jgi:hypothetical protein
MPLLMEKKKSHWFCYNAISFKSSEYAHATEEVGREAKVILTVCSAGRT